MKENELPEIPGEHNYNKIIKLIKEGHTHLCAFKQVYSFDGCTCKNK